MQDGFIRVAAASVAVTVADAVDNAQKIRAREDPVRKQEDDSPISAASSADAPQSETD